MSKQLNFSFITGLKPNSSVLSSFLTTNRQLTPNLVKNEAISPSNKPSANLNKSKPQSQKLENQLLNSILKSLILEFFPDRTDLLDYQIAWSSRRQKRTLASCNLKARRILVAKELSNLDYHRFLPALIYHELCHAVLGYSVRSEKGKSRWHGKEFKALEQRHPEIRLLNIWIREGGWRQAVRRHRAKFSATKPRSKIKAKRKSIFSQLFRKFISK